MKQAAEQIERNADDALTRALEQRPVVTVPADFALRVMASLPPQRAPRPAMQAGRTVALIGAVVLFAVMFALAPHAAPSFASLAFDMELLVLAQLLAIVYWLAKAVSSE